MTGKTRLFALALLLACSGRVVGEEPSRKISFNRDVRGILSDHCFACHGPDAKAVAADLRLDLPEEALDSVIVPGDAEASPLVARILSEDLEQVMPPPESHKPLTESAKLILRRWIEQGAEYESHWAYQPLQRPSVPVVEDLRGWVINDIDRFVLAGMQAAKVEPSPTADQATLTRRLSFDLTGLPPDTDDVEALQRDASLENYQRLVDRLLDSPRYGERLAIYWLDLVRYADTVGYHGDQDVSISPYRDYVIQAFNDNMPYSQFVREQLAGDLLPEPTLQQLIASGYNRLNQTTEEGGSQAKEYLSIYFADRVRNLSQVFMGATVGCAQCHDHKYDPYTTRDFYSLGAFFADIQEQGVYGARARPPEVMVPDLAQQQQLSELDTRLAEKTQQVEMRRQSLLAEQPGWEKTQLAVQQQAQPVEQLWIEDAQDTGGSSSGDWNFVAQEQGPVHSGKLSRRQSAAGLDQHFFIEASQPVEIDSNTRFFTWVYLDAENPPQALMLQLHSAQDGGWSHRAVWGSDDIEYGRQQKNHSGYQRLGALPSAGQWQRLEVDADKVGLKPGMHVDGMAFTQFGGTAYWDASGWSARPGLSDQLLAVLKIEAQDRTPEQTQQLQAAYLAGAAEYVDAQKSLTAIQAERDQLVKSIPTSMIVKSVEPREIRVLPRGNWMDDSGEVVQPAIPAFLGSLDSQGRATRLDLAEWLCGDENPLTARTMVNRLWFLMFGRGICASVDDLGGQGSYPSHPELLDYLACEFVDSGWDIKYVLRLIAHSATYRQSSQPSPQLREADPYNELFARQGRFRVSAEMVRDAALWTSGLLIEQQGGRSARPYQPAGYYAQLNFPRREYQADHGTNQYRRGVYTHWQRTFLHPMLKAFDAPSREECTAMRSRSNTPLQALTLLNDPSFVETARVFAEKILRESATMDRDRLDWAYRRALSRSADAFELEQMLELLAEHRRHYAAHPDQAVALTSAGEAARGEDLDVTELAAWTSAARVILNLREMTTRY